MEDRKPRVVPEENGREITSIQPEFPPGMAPKMLKLVKVLNDLERKMEPLISKPHHEVLNKLAPIERAKVGLMEVYTINSLFWVLMRTSGEDIDSTLRDDYKVEMGRLKETRGKLAELEARAHRRGVDVQAASRFIERGLGINQRRREAEEDEVMEQDSRGFNRGQRRGRHTWFPQSDGDNQEEVDGNQEYHNEDEELPQPSTFVKKTKKKKKIPANARPQPSHNNYGEVGNDTSGYQGSGEDSCLPTPPEKLIKKKMKKSIKIKSASMETAESLPEKKGSKKKKNVKNDSELSPGKKLKKKVFAEGNGLQSTDAEVEESVPKKRKKKRKSEDDDADHLNGDGIEVVNEGDEDVTAAVSSKKKGKKGKKGLKVTETDITSFLDVTRGRINYEIEDDRDLSNKGRNWYEQGWT